MNTEQYAQMEETREGRMLLKREKARVRGGNDAKNVTVNNGIQSEGTGSWRPTERIQLKKSRQPPINVSSGSLNLEGEVNMHKK